MDGGLLILLVFIGLSLMDALARAQRRKRGEPGPDAGEDGVPWEIEDVDSLPAERPGRIATDSELPERGGSRHGTEPDEPTGPGQPPGRPARSMIPPELWEEITALAQGEEPSTATSEPETEPGEPWREGPETSVPARPERGPIQRPSKPTPVARDARPAPRPGQTVAKLPEPEGAVEVPEGAGATSMTEGLAVVPAAADHGRGRRVLFHELFGKGDPDSLRRAFVLKEVLGPPVSDRRDEE